MLKGFEYIHVCVLVDFQESRGDIGVSVLKVKGFEYINWTLFEISPEITVDYGSNKCALSLSLSLSLSRFIPSLPTGWYG